MSRFWVSRDALLLIIVFQTPRLASPEFFRETFEYEQRHLPSLVLSFFYKKTVECRLYLLKDVVELSLTTIRALGWQGNVRFKCAHSLLLFLYMI